MKWNFGSVDGTLLVSLRDGNASSFGHLTWNKGEPSWLTANSIGRSGAPVHVEAPAMGGTLELTPVGDPAAPKSLMATGSIGGEQVNTTLLPMMNRSIEDIVDSYRRSYAVFTLAEVNGSLQCTRAVYGGGTLKAVGGTIGGSAAIGFDYENPSNLTFPDDVKNGICRPGSDGTSVELHIPNIRSEEGTSGPVIIQFEGDMDHFSSPPFREPHEHINHVFYEEYKRSCLSIEYANSGSAETLHFNHAHPRERGHKSVIIVPTVF